MKKLLLVIMIAIMSVGGIATFSACNTDDEFKVGIIHIGDPADGAGYSFAHDQGIVAMQQNLGLKDSQIIRKLDIADGDNTALRNAIEACIAEGAKIIFGTSFGYMDTMDAMAEQYPNIIFSHATGYKSNNTNFNNYFGRIYQARYLSGIAAGLKTETNNIGYVTAYGKTIGTDPMAETASGINAFALGVASVNPEATINVRILNSWYDPAQETALAEALLDAGCDVIAQHCDTPNPQLAAEAVGKWGCGYNSDMSIQAPEAHLTAPIWNWGVYYTAATEVAMQCFEDGTFNSAPWAEFGNYYAGLKEGFVDISPLSDNIADGTAERIALARALIISGEWDVFSGVALSFEMVEDVLTLVKTDAALLDSEDNVIREAGAGSVADSVIQGTMGYYVYNVVEGAVQD